MPRPLSILIWLPALAAVAWPAPAAADDLAAARAALDAAYRGELAALARRCDDADRRPLAAEVRAWLPIPERGALAVYLIDELPAAETDSDRPAGGEGVADPPSTDTWRDQFNKLRRARAAALVELAREAAAAAETSLAMLWLTEAVREDPDQATARRALGYVRHADGWQTPFARKLLDSGQVWHPRFGWLLESHVGRYERGERRLSGRWVDAEEDARRRRPIGNGWQVRSEHYALTTNHSLEEGVALARRLERLHQVWRQLFAGYYLEPAQLRRALAGRGRAPLRRQTHEVVYYRTRDEYNATLVRRQPRIGMTLGLYFDDTRRAHFFAGPEQHPATLWHEGVHQLFQESRPVARQVGRADNFWIVEGIATYFESLTQHDGYVTLGSADAGRLPAARARLLETDFYVPLAELTAMSMDQVQRHPQIARLYSQAAGLATFLMHAADGRYRQPLTEYLIALYTGRADSATLARLTGRTYDQLDAEYREWTIGTMSDE